MSMIDVETAYSGCWEDCPIFEIEDLTQVCDGGTINMVVWHSYRCKHVEGCEHLIDYIKERKNEE